MALASGALSFAGSAFEAGVANAQAQPFANDLEVLNYALTLENLEANLYNIVLTQKPMTVRQCYYRATVAGLIEKTESEKMVSILQKTWKKMSPAAREQALALPFSAREKELLQRALA